jgi:hypothetical protein
MTEAEIAWAAGIIEGEGCIGWVTRTSVSVNVSMTDEDVIRRLHAVLGVGGVTAHDRSPHKTQYRWSVRNRDGAEFVLRAIRPWMGQRRGVRIDEALERLERNPGRGRPIDHGTVSGYNKEERRGLTHCDPCRRAYNDARRIRERRAS